MLLGRVIAHEELCRGQPLTEEEVAALTAVGALWFGGGKKKAKAMRRTLHVLATTLPTDAHR